MPASRFLFLDQILTWRHLDGRPQVAPFWHCTIHGTKAVEATVYHSNEEETYKVNISSRAEQCTEKPRFGLTKGNLLPLLQPTNNPWFMVSYLPNCTYFHQTSSFPFSALIPHHEAQHARHVVLNDKGAEGPPTLPLSLKQKQQPTPCTVPTEQQPEPSTRTSTISARSLNVKLGGYWEGWAEFFWPAKTRPQLCCISTTGGLRLV